MLAFVGLWERLPGAAGGGSWVGSTLRVPALGHWLYSHMEMGPRGLQLCRGGVNLLKFSALYVMELVFLVFLGLSMRILLLVRLCPG